jgi:oligopeptide/dipeptide ABC transporter ATP-binding protein
MSTTSSGTPTSAATTSAPVQTRAVNASLLLDVRNLVKHYPARGGFLRPPQGSVKAVDGVSFQLSAGQTLGLVGESGCGKTTVGRALLRLLPDVHGEVLYQGRDLLKLSNSELRPLRRDLQIIFQDSFGSLNPRMTVAQIVGEPLRIHQGLRGAKLRAEAARLINQVGLQSHVLDRYPHEFSGGQRQRIGIARAISLNPSFIVCDEPTSALDVSIRAQIINLLQDLQGQFGLSYLMISHDLGVVRHISSAVAVMYLGRIVEQAPTNVLYQDARHPYSAVLLSAIPIPNPKLRASSRKRVTSLDTDDTLPTPTNLPSGCVFHPRCPLYAAKGRPAECQTKAPELMPLAGTPDHLVRCHFPTESVFSVK